MSHLLPDSIRNRLPYLLAQAHQRQLNLFDEYTADLQISGREYATLRIVDARPHLWQSEIAQALGLDRTTVTYLVDGLEKRGWLSRQRDPADRRAHVITLTEAGRSALAEIQPLALAAMDTMLAPLAEAEQEQLRRLLQRLLAG